MNHDAVPDPRAPPRGESAQTCEYLREITANLARMRVGAVSCHPWKLVIPPIRAAWPAQLRQLTDSEDGTGWLAVVRGVSRCGARYPALIRLYTLLVSASSCASKRSVLPFQAVVRLVQSRVRSHGRCAHADA
eukprot:3585528-Prymnesium_polylepis.1